MVKNTRQDRGKWKLMSTLSIERNSEKKRKEKEMKFQVLDSRTPLL